MSISLDEKTEICCQIAMNKKAFDLIVLDLRGHTSIADYFMICSASSVRQIHAIVDELIEKLKKENTFSNGVEGYNNAGWVLIDFYDLVVHIFMEETRNFYDIERLWGNAPKVKINVT